MKTISFLFVLFILSSAAYAEEIFIWKNKDGSKTISNIKPQEKVVLIDMETYTPDSPEAIAAYQQERKFKSYLMDAEEQRRSAVIARDAQLRAYNRAIDETEDKYKKETEKQNRARLEDLKIEKERIQAIENKNYDEARRLRLKERQQSIDRERNNIGD